MKYQYGTDDSDVTSQLRNISVIELTNMIAEGVKYYKWNIYYGGETNSRPAKCKLEMTGYVFHNHLLIYGDEYEFKKLESNLSQFMTVIPRKFTS